MAIKMEALRTFVGAEGFLRRGQMFEVKSMDRAKDLSEVGLAKMINNDENNLPFADEEILEEEQPLPEDQKPIESIPEDEPPPQGEMWGVKSLGGGWYELPSGEREQGFENARESLYYLLRNEFERVETSEEETTDEKVHLIEPVDPPIIVPNPTKTPMIVFTGEPDVRSNYDFPPFEEAVNYVGGGWYELPNGERVQGKESARDVYEAYTEERGDS